MKTIGWAATACLVIALAGASGATAQDQAPAFSGTNIVIGGALSDDEAADHQIYLDAETMFNQRGFVGLIPILPKLRQALDRAPPEYPMVAEVDGGYVVRAANNEDALLVAMTLAASVPKDRVVATQITTTSNTYPMIALFLGSEAIERGEYVEGLAYLDRALVWQPLNPLLLREKGAALSGLKRWAESLALMDQALSSSDLLLTMRSAPLHRARGFALIELGRLDEALAAYEKSLELEPGNRTATAEVEYIRGLQAGKPETESILIAPDAPQPEG